MKYLKAFANICLRHGDNDCEGCPFAKTETGYDSCLKYVIKNPDETQKKIVEYVRAYRKEREDAHLD